MKKLMHRKAKRLLTSHSVEETGLDSGPGSVLQSLYHRLSAVISAVTVCGDHRKGAE
jgi:hypothetical protein